MLKKLFKKNRNTKLNKYPALTIFNSLICSRCQRIFTGFENRGRCPGCNSEEVEVVAKKLNSCD